MNINPHNVGDSKHAVDNALTESYESTHAKCYVCTAPAQLRIYPVSEEYLSAELQSGLFICTHCNTKVKLDTRMYRTVPVE